MQYNPHRVKLNQITVELALVRTEVEALREQCQRYERFDVAHVREQAEAAATVLPERKERLQELQARLRHAETIVAELKQKAARGLNPLRWFSAERKRLVQHRDAAILSHSQLVEATTTAQASLEKAQDFEKQVGNSLRWYAAFDPESAQSRIRSLLARKQELESQCPELEAQSESLDAELAPYLKDLQEAKRRRDYADGKLADAKQLEQKMAGANSGLERRKVHDLARGRLGYERPAEAIRIFQRDLAAADRDIKKLNQRLEQIASRHSRRIDKIVFDGMNLCFSRGIFVGISPLEAVARSLGKQTKLIVVFDGSIRKRGFNEAKLRGAFGGDVIVHIVNGAADEFVLDLASDEYEFVVSNDNFIDYRTKPAVSGRRIFKYESVDNRIMIPDLGVSVAYS